MQALLDVILPVFLVIGFGYLAVWKNLFSTGAVDGLMSFTQNFAFPCLLFRAIATLDLGQEFDPALLASYYAGAFAGFLAGLFGARILFGRPWEDSVAIGFCCLFSNTLMLGLPITERAYGAEALAANFAIIAIHTPFCYLVGIAAMEIVLARKGGGGAVIGRVFSSLLHNPLVISVVLGFLFSLSGLSLPAMFADALDLIVRAALPVALFALGGVLFQYRPEGDMRTILYICAVSLVLHPAMVWGTGRALALDDAQFRSAIVTAAMAPGINAYIFASIYGVARRVAASSVLIATAGSLVTAWAWLMLL